MMLTSEKRRIVLWSIMSATALVFVIATLRVNAYDGGNYVGRPVIVPDRVIENATQDRPHTVLVGSGATEAQIDLGYVEPGSTEWIVFLIQNSSGSSVNVFDVRSDCECLTPLESPRVLRPGVATSVKVKFKVPNVRVPFSQSVLMLTDDRSRVRITLRVKAMIGVTAAAPR